MEKNNRLLPASMRKKEKEKCEISLFCCRQWFGSAWHLNKKKKYELYKSECVCVCIPL